jgi:hypothetical protein
VPRGHDIFTMCTEEIERPVRRIEVGYRGAASPLDGNFAKQMCRFFLPPKV